MKRPVRPRLGDFCAVYWKDACHDSMEADPLTVGLIPCVTLGVLMRLDRDVVSVCQSRFDHPDGTRTYRETMVIPRSQVTRIVVGKRNEGESK